MKSIQRYISEKYVEICDTDKCNILFVYDHVEYNNLYIIKNPSPYEMDDIMNDKDDFMMFFGYDVNIKNKYIK